VKIRIALLSILFLIPILMTLLPLPNDIATAQTLNKQPIYSEYSYIQPHLVQNSTHYIYVTTWGNYSFFKAMPYICKYTYRDGKLMASFSTFWINTYTILAPLNPTVLTANNTHFQVSVDAYKLTTKMATLMQTWDFSRRDKPKISILLTKTDNWNLGDFNIFWVVAGFQYFKWNETYSETCNRQMFKWKRDIRVEMGETTNPTDWSEWLVVDWSDEGTSDVSIGQFSIFGYSLAVVKVDFGVNDGKVDPSLIGQSTVSTATSYKCCCCFNRC